MDNFRVRTFYMKDELEKIGKKLTADDIGLVCKRIWFPILPSGTQPKVVFNVCDANGQTLAEKYSPLSNAKDINYELVYYEDYSSTTYKIAQIPVSSSTNTTYRYAYVVLRSSMPSNGAFTLSDVSFSSSRGVDSFLVYQGNVGASAYSAQSIYDTCVLTINASGDKAQYFRFSLEEHAGEYTTCPVLFAAKQDPDTYHYKKIRSITNLSDDYPVYYEPA